MVENRVDRKLAAILAADVVDYSKMMDADEVGTLRRVNHRLDAFIEPTVASYRGRIFKKMGDGLLVEFGSIVEAVECAAELQQGMVWHNEQAPDEPSLVLRIGVHLGDVIAQDGDVFGEGVNIAARLEPLAPHGGICVSKVVYDQVQKRVALDFEHVGARTLKNIAEPVHLFVAVPRAAYQPKPVAKTPTSAPSLGLPDKPSIAVLAFDNMSSDPEQSHFADGITEDILTNLSFISSLFVIARTSAFAYRDKARDLREIGRELGVRHVLEGSVRRSGERLRVTAQLMDTLDGSHVWADKYDRRLADVFDIQDELTREIVTALRLVLTNDEQARVWQHSTTDIAAWADATRGFDHIWRGTARDMAAARSYLTAALRRDPQYTKAMSALALTHYFDIRFGYTKAVEDAKRQLIELTERALAINPDEPYAVLMKGNILAFDQRFEEAAAEATRAATISPNDAWCWIALARILINAERLEEGERAARQAMRLNPFSPVNYYAVLGDALVHQGRTAEALKVFGKLLDKNPNYISAHLHLVGLYQDAGAHEKARAAAAEVLRIDPTYRVSMAGSFYLSSDAARKERFLGALRAAGLPE
jgi:adenylate cyclase